MSRTVLAKPDLKWEGFEPVAYRLDISKVRHLPVTDATAGCETTIEDIIHSFRDEKVEVDKDELFDTVLKSGSRTVVFKGPTFNTNLLRSLYWFRERNLSLFEALWFYYDKDVCRDGDQESYSFFLVGNDKIIDQEYTLCDYRGSGFDPTVLVPAARPDPTWFRHADLDEAVARLWYRRFYTETRMGQLMVLRPDEPLLYHYPEGRWRVDSGFQLLHGWLREIRGVLGWMRIAIWVLLGLVAVDLIRRWL